MIDAKMLESDLPRLSGLVELANLSSMIGNLLAAGIVRASAGMFKRAGPHKYQDLRSNAPGSPHVEIKMSLEDNAPKGHLPKEGHYLTCRYVLGGADGSYERGHRGDVAWIWEIRFGYLEERHFNRSNTPGDSGKTTDNVLEHNETRTEESHEYDELFVQVIPRVLLVNRSIRPDRAEALTRRPGNYDIQTSLFDPDMRGRVFHTDVHDIVTDSDGIPVVGAERRDTRGPYVDAKDSLELASLLKSGRERARPAKQVR